MKEIPDINPSDFKGYDIDELRYRRAFALARYEMAKMRMGEEVESVKDGVSGFGPKGIMGKILRNLSFIDYALIGYRIYSKMRKFKKSKK